MAENNILHEVLERIVRIETKIDNYNNVKGTAYEALNLAKSNREKIEKIESNTTWLWRTVGAALIVAFIGAFINFR